MMSKRMSILLVVLTIVSGLIGGAITGRIFTPKVAIAEESGQQSYENPSLDDIFRILEIRFDESAEGRRPTPRIPKDWHFVGVSNGEKGNCNNLWFQDKEGNIYMVSGFTSGVKFIISSIIGKIEALPTPVTKKPK